ncbi:hypothetical protein B0H16DRAFT_1719122 [Mycena metata]|uniref:Uncharacterized protein n=1 Tax=Mycena metata TaxID=1033252 RepID=A0AAD7JEE9_9AGAR|nr:hypothetical protein B0H16DRAFT_1719122 [Mycena metata]
MLIVVDSILPDGAPLRRGPPAVRTAGLHCGFRDGAYTSYLSIYFVSTSFLSYSAFSFRFANTRAVLPYHPPARRLARCFPYISSPPFASHRTPSSYNFPRHPALPRCNFPPPSQFSTPSFSRALPAPAASHWLHSLRVLLAHTLQPYSLPIFSLFLPPLPPLPRTPARSSHFPSLPCFPTPILPSFPSTSSLSLLFHSTFSLRPL